VGAYSIAEKLINAIKRSTHPIFQAAYPRWIQLHKNDRDQLHKETVFFLTGLLCWGGGIWIGLFLFGKEILTLITSVQTPEGSKILSILSITPLLGVISHFAGYQILAPNDKEHIQTIIIASCGSIGLMSSIILTSFFSTTGLAWSIVIIEIFIMIFMCKYASATYKQNNFRKD
jgi:O-antigen/teichoic acid export membrane protein